jgi:hypothetical protein
MIPLSTRRSSTRDWPPDRSSKKRLFLLVYLVGTLVTALLLRGDELGL